MYLLEVDLAQAVKMPRRGPKLQKHKITIDKSRHIGRTTTTFHTNYSTCSHETRDKKL